MDRRESAGLRRRQLDGASRFEEGVRQAALVAAADEEPAAGQGLKDQGFRRIGAGDPGAGEGVRRGRRSSGQADDDGGIRSGGGSDPGGLAAGSEDARQLVEGDVLGQADAAMGDVPT